MARTQRRVMASAAIWIGALALGAARVTVRAAPPAAGDDGGWVGSWATSPMIQDKNTYSEPPLLEGATLRQIVHLSAGGSRLRVRLDNAFGEKALVVKAVHVASGSGDGKVDPDSDRPANFDGSASTIIAGGALVWSDPIAMDTNPGADVAVTIHFGDVPQNVTGHSLSLAASFLAADADPAAAELAGAHRVDHWFVLDGVDVSGGATTGAVVAFGDSITDGYRSTPGANRRWPDFLDKRLAADPATAAIGVLNEGISGNRLTDNGTGPSALARFDRDVLGQTQARWVVLLEGINDIGTDQHPDTHAIVHALELADTQIVARAHAHGLKVYGATILPFIGAAYASPEKEANRTAVNTWMRSSGTFDAVIDLDAATRNPADRSTLLPAYDSDDHLHPNDAGYQHMADAVDLELFRR